MDRKRASDDESCPSPPKVAKLESSDDRHGSSGMSVTLTANYFKIKRQPEFSLNQYRVDFVPEVDVTQTRKNIISKSRAEIGERYTFDGASLYMSSYFDDRTFKADYDGRTFQVTIRRTGEIKNTDSTAFQLFNLIFRDAMSGLKLQNVRRDYYDPQAKIAIPKGKLELWPGYITSIRQHEFEVLMSAEINHKFMRKETIHDIAKGIMQSSKNWQEDLKKAVIGTTVLTDYTNKTYLIDDIDFGMTPRSTFKPSYTEDETTYEAYYRTKYNITIKDSFQFMLISVAKQRDLRAGQNELIYLIPELCRATGMTDAMRADFKLMQELSNYTRLSPDDRVKQLLKFNKRIQSTPASINVLTEWKMELEDQLVTIPGRELSAEAIMFGNDMEANTNSKGEWQFRNGFSMYKSMDIKRWAVVFPAAMRADAENFCKVLKKAAGEMMCPMTDPLMKELENDRQDSYIGAIREINERSPKIILAMLPTNRADRYAAIKKACLIEFGVPIQVVVKKTMNHKNVGSIASKVVIQMSAKLGGIPWLIRMPVKGLMTVGFDVSHHPRDRSRSVGALVATMDIKKSSAFYSVTSNYSDGNAMNIGLANHMQKALEIYVETCGELPQKILFYRDGVGEGQIQYLMEKEVQPLISKLRSIYGSVEPKLAYIIVNKRINTRMFKKTGSRYDNPKPGTVVDRVITLPERNDFFLISQHVGQGTVSPTSYNIVFNNSGLNKDRLEVLTFKYSHLYYNWSGTTRIPAVSQYAKKLAFLTSQSLQAPVHEKLERSLYFL